MCLTWAAQPCAVCAAMSFSVGVLRCGPSCRCDQGYRWSCCSEPERPRLLHGLRRLSHVRLGFVVAGNCASPLILRVEVAELRSWYLFLRLAAWNTHRRVRSSSHPLRSFTFELSWDRTATFRRGDRPIAAGAAHGTPPCCSRCWLVEPQCPARLSAPVFTRPPTTSVKLFLVGPWSLASTHCVQREHRPVASDRTLLCA